MRYISIISLLLLVSCKSPVADYSPSQIALLSDDQLCDLSDSYRYEPKTEFEISKRGINCDPAHRECVRNGMQPRTHQMDYCVEQVRREKSYERELDIRERELRELERENDRYYDEKRRHKHRGKSHQDEHNHKKNRHGKPRDKHRDARDDKRKKDDRGGLTYTRHNGEDRDKDDDGKSHKHDNKRHSK